MKKEALLSLDERILAKNLKNKSKTMVKKLLSPPHEDNSNIYIIYGNLILSLYGEDNNKICSPKAIEKFTADLQNTITPRILSVYYHLKMNRVSTIPTMEEDLKIPNQSLHRYLSKLIDLGFITRINNKFRRRKAGPRPNIYAINGYSKEEYIKFIQENSSISPGLRESNKITQFILNEYLPERPIHEEIHLREIFHIAKDQAPQFHPKDLTQEIAKKLHENGVRVWR